MLKEYQQLVKRKIQEKERHEPNFAKKTNKMHYLREQLFLEIKTRA